VPTGFVEDLRRTAAAPVDGHHEQGTDDCNAKLTQCRKD
jgi:hypothetical protein